jgi:TatD DNase family protein
VIDSHAHLYVESFDGDRRAVLERARAAGVEALVNVGIDLPTSLRALEMARESDWLFASAGLHPTTPVADLNGSLDQLRALALSGRPKLVAIGEIGLDYHWKEVGPEAQKPKLRAQLALALETSLPVIIHCRDALPDLLDLLAAESRLPPGVFHCFAGGAEEARRALELGFHLSFCGNVTYPRAETLRVAAREVPLERLLLETDSPYLPPQARRGQRNEPAFGLLTRDALAGILGVAPLELDRRASENTRHLFRLPAG